MRKIQILSVVFIAVVALSAIVAGSASATRWLNKLGEELLSKETAELQARFVISDSAQSSTIECDTLLIGTVGPGASDEILGVENLAKTSSGLVTCTSSNILCKNPLVHTDNLPWKSQLQLISGVTWDVFTADNSGPGWDILCSGILIALCALNGLMLRFEGNNANGATFSFKGKESGEATCSDGGKGTITSPAAGEVLGFTVS